MIRDRNDIEEIAHDIASMKGVDLHSLVFQPMTDVDYRIDLKKARYEAMDEAAHHQEQLDLQQRINAVIEKVAPQLDEAELSLLYWATGIHKQEKK